MQEQSINNSKLIQLLESLDTKELKQFEDYLNSPYFNKNQKVVQLFQMLKKHYPKFEKSISKKELFTKLAGVKYKKNETLNSKDDQKLRYLMNQITNYVQDFIIDQNARSKGVERNTLLLESVLDRRMYKLYPKIIKQVSQEHHNQPHRDNRFYQLEHRLQESEFHYKQIVGNRNKENGLQNVINNFHYYYLADQLRYFCAAINRENILNIKYDFPLKNELISHLKATSYEHIPIIDIYFKIILLLTEDEADSNFQKLKQQMKNSESQFPKDELRQIYGFMLNFSNRRIKSGKSSYFQERFDIYENGLILNIWTAGLYFSINHFILIIRNALALSKFEWTSNFLETHKHELEQRFQSTIPSFAKAYLYFHQKKYNIAHEYLLQVGEPEDFYYELYYRTLIIQIYYEKSSGGLEDRYENPIINAIDALRFYINRNHSEYIKETYSNFVNLMKRICRIKFSSQIDPPSEKHLQKVIQDILTTELLVERHWLSEKANEFIQQPNQ